MNEITLREAIGFDSDLEVDEAAGIVKGVKILGSVSKNKIVFPAAVRKEAHGIFHHARVNWDHRPKNATETSLDNRFGYLLNVREDEATNCTRADVCFNPATDRGRDFIWMAKQKVRDSQGRGLCGFSIIGAAKPGPKDSEGRTVVEKITAVDSFDLVDNPANTLGLRESADDVLPAEEPPAPMDKPADGEAHADTGCMLEILAICNGPGSDSEKLAKIKEHCAAHDELTGKGNGEMSDDEAEDEKENVADMKESVREVRKKHVLVLCESHKITPSASHMSLLIRVPKGKREDAVKKLALVKRPKSGPPSLDVRESAASPPPPPPAPVETEEQIRARIAKEFKQPY